MLVDNRLVASVQKAAGRRCHHAANLVQSYTLAAHLCGIARQRNDDSELAEARSMLSDSERALRCFLSECRGPGMTHSLSRA
jgi:hypothetical protein